MILQADFYARDTVVVARELLGKVLVHETAEGTTSGIIVETEAYMQDDPACHAYRGKTPRNETMFGEPGKAYVYLIYGIHHCFNAVTREEGKGEAVLVRALCPLRGEELMRRRRKTTCPSHRLASGPGNLCRVMGITRDQDGVSLQESPLYVISDNVAVSSDDVAEKTRIGLSVAEDRMLRFYLSNYQKYVSRR